MPNEKFTQLPTVANSTVNDIICAVQAGVSTQQTLSQVLSLSLDNTVLNYAGDPNGNLSGDTYQLCWDTVNDDLYICTTSGTSSTAVWTLTGLNGIIPPSRGGTGVANPADHGVAVAQGSSNFVFKTLTDGQLLIGSSGADPATSTLTAGSNVSIVNGAGSITISAAGASAITWSVVAGTSQAMNVNNGYIPTNVALTSFSLPASNAVGDVLQIVGKGTGGWTVIQGAGQSIVIGTSTSTPGVGGSISSSEDTDAIYLVCTDADLEWTAAMGPQGNITVV